MGGRGSREDAGGGGCPGCALAHTSLPLHSLYDIYWREETEDLLRAVEEKKPSLKIIC